MEFVITNIATEFVILTSILMQCCEGSAEILFSSVSCLVVRREESICPMPEQNLKVAAFCVYDLEGGDSESVQH